MWIAFGSLYYCYGSQFGKHSRVVARNQYLRKSNKKGSNLHVSRQQK